MTCQTKRRREGSTMKSPRRYTTRKKHKTTSVRVPRQEQVKEKSKTSEEPTEESKSTEVNV